MIFRSAANWQIPEKGFSYPVAMLLVLVVIVLRDPSVIMAPPAVFEDGRELLEFYQYNRAPAGIFRDYAGYVSLGPNLLGYIFGIQPPWIVVHLLLWAAFLIAAAMLALPAASWVFPGALTQAERAALVTILALAPVGNFAILQMTMYSIWHLLFGLALLSAGARVLTWGPCSAVILVGAAALTSNPVALVLLPVLLWRAFKARVLPERVAFATLFCVGLAYPFFGIVAMPPGGTSLDPGVMLSFGRAFFERVVAETLISTELRMAFRYRGLEHIFWLAGIAWLGVLAWTWRMRGSIQAGLFVPIVLFHIVAVALLAATVYVRGSLLDTAWSHRYSYVSSLLVIVAMALTGIEVSRGRSWRRWLVLGTVVWLSATYFLSVDFYRSPAREGYKMADALALLRSGEETCVIVDRGIWSVTLEFPGDPVSCRRLQERN